MNGNKRDYFGEQSDVNSMSWAETRRAYEDGSIGLYVDRTLAIRAAANGLKTSILGPILGIAAPIALLAGIAMAISFAWWWFLLGILGCVMGFRASRQSAVNAVKKAALHDEILFHMLRDNKIVWFEKTQTSQEN